MRSFRKLLFIKMKETILGATHLNFLECRLPLCWNKFWTLRSFAGIGFDRSQNFDQVYHALGCRVAGEAFRTSAAVCLHDLRAINLARGSMGCRSLLECQARGALASGISKACCKVNAGRCQRTAILADVAGAGYGLGRQGEKVLCGRGFGIGFGKHRLRSGFEHNHFFDDLVSLGDLPVDIGRDQDPCPDRLAGTDSGLDLRVPFPI